MTGRAAGFCAGFDRPGFSNPVGGRGFFGFGRGRGMGRGMGFGRGIGNRFFAGGGYPPTAVEPAAQKQTLQNQAEALQAQLDAIRKRLDALTSS